MVPVGVDQLREGAALASYLVNTVRACGAEPVLLCVQQTYTAVKVRNEADVYAIADLVGMGEDVLSGPATDLASDGTTARLPGLMIHTLTVQIEAVQVLFSAYDRQNDPDPWNGTTSNGSAVNPIGEAGAP